MSVSYSPAMAPWDSGFVIFFSEFDPDLDDDPTPSRLVCLHCLISDGNEQLGRGLDLARGQVEWDRNRGKWVVPPDAAWARL